MSDYNEIKVSRTQVSTILRKEALQKSFDSCVGIRFGDPLTLLIDCDSFDSFLRVKETLMWAVDLLGIAEAWFTHSKTRDHKHVFVRLYEPMSQRERALLQGALGGDPKRAVLDWRWAEQGGEGECFLFEPNHKTHPIDLGGVEFRKGAY